jgi:hypothetical protein
MGFDGEKQIIKCKVCTNWMHIRYGCKHCKGEK